MGCGFLNPSPSRGNGYVPRLYCDRRGHGSAYALVGADQTHTVKCRVTGTNAYDSTTIDTRQLSNGGLMRILGLPIPFTGETRKLLSSLPYGGIGISTRSSTNHFLVPGNRTSQSIPTPRRRETPTRCRY